MHYHFMLMCQQKRYATMAADTKGCKSVEEVKEPCIRRVFFYHRKSDKIERRERKAL